MTEQPAADTRTRLINLLGHTSSDYLDGHFAYELGLDEIADEILSSYARELDAARAQRAEVLPAPPADGDELRDRIAELLAPLTEADRDPEDGARQWTDYMRGWNNARTELLAALRNTAVLPTPADRDELRDRIINALHEARRPVPGTLTEAGAVGRMADAVMGVLPAVVDRGAVLNEAAEAVATDRAATIPVHTAWAQGNRRAEDLLRRLAAEARDREQQDEACTNCRGSGLDPRCNGEFACPDCMAAAEAQQDGAKP